MQLYSMPSSGNSYKVRLLLAFLGRRDVALVDVEYLTEALDSAKARGALPFGKAPALVFEDGSVLPESNAILCWLGEGSAFWPADPLERAQMLGWMFWEQNQHEGVIAVRMALRSYPHRAADATPEVMEGLLTRGHEILALMEARLASHDWLVDNGATLADICLYAYTHRAGEIGGFDMARFPGITAWCDRIRTLPGYVTIL